MCCDAAEHIGGVVEPSQQEVVAEIQLLQCADRLKKAPTEADPVYCALPSG